MNEFQNIKCEKNIGNSIESLYILKDIFSFLSEKQKLKIIIYNKYIQNKLDINIKDYKRIRGIYREGERNGKGKEYDISTSLIIFKGKYLNGERNGKGKEYDKNGILTFEGEYFNEMRNGNGKEYNKGKLIFKGEYINGMRNGKGKEYNSDGTIIFKGEYFNGKRIKKKKKYKKTKKKRI